MNNKITEVPLVLIVDDDAMTRMQVKEALEPEGFRIIGASNGAAGIEVFQRERPDIVLLDVSMPGMDGFECCKRMRQLPGGQRVPIVVITVRDDDASISQAFEAGATDFVSKPMRWKLFGYRVRYLLRTRRALEDLASSEAGLAGANAALTEMNNKLALAHVQLLQSEKLASIGQLAAGVAHEINNPIGYIFSNFGTLESYLKKLFNMLAVYEKTEKMIESPEAIAGIKATKQEIDFDFLKDDVPAIMRESKEGLDRVKEIVQNLKDFARIDRAPDWCFDNIHHGLDSTLNVIRSETKYKADIIKEYGELPEIECVLSQLNQVFMNIIVNAAHAMGDRFGKITIRTSVRQQNICVEISDDGSGISEQDIPRLFEPFFTTKPIGQGTGLGLSIAYGIVNSHHGRINVQSVLNQGTSFFITLPIRQSVSERRGAGRV